MAGVAGNRKLNLENISADEVLVNTNGTQAYVKAEVGEKVYIIGSKAYVLIKFSDACLTTLTEAEANFSAAAIAMHNQLEQSSSSGGSDDKATFLCGVPNEQTMRQISAAVDSASSNRFQLLPGAVTPAAAVIPMRSNTQTYGPYTSDNFGSARGGCTAEQNTDLAPWVFGGSAAMTLAGKALANSMQASLNEGATGSITLLGLPQLGYMGSYTTNPNLTGISVNFGSSGITTNYNFQTFTPKFGALTRSAVEQMKSVAKNRQKQLQFLRNQAIMAYNTNRKLKRVDAKKDAKKDNVAIAEGKTLTRCMIGEIYDWYEQESGNSQRTVVGMDSLAKTALELRYDYEKKAFMSLDGLFGPVSKDGDGDLPQYAAYKNEETTGSSGNTTQQNKSKSSPIAAQPPLAKEETSSNTNSGGSGNSSNITLDQYNLDINQKYYDPLTNKISDSNKHHHEGDGAGHSVDLVGRKDEPLKDGMLMNHLPQDDDDRYSDDYRFLGLRGPLVLHSWGYDTNGKPVPNAADTESAVKSGTFTNQSLQDKFLKDWLNKPKTWPVAPVDLRFDRERGMWVSPQPYKIVVAKLKENLEPKGSAKAYLINEGYGDKLYDKDGEEIVADGTESSKALINVVDRIGQKYNKDDLVYAYYDTYKSEYIILSSGSTTGVIRFKLVDICKATSSNEPAYGDDWTKEYGRGDKYLNNDSYAVRLNCNRQIIDKEGNVLSDADISNLETLKKHLIIVKGAIGKWGPSFNKLSDDPAINPTTEQVQKWKSRAAEGYAVKIVDNTPTNDSLSSTTSAPQSCSYNVPCPLTYEEETGSDSASTQTKTVDDVYDILYLESYARVIHGYLTQDLYCEPAIANDKYAQDSWKKANPKGNASITVTKYYGNSPNGMEPFYIKDNEPEVSIRVFDPWYSEESSNSSDDYKYRESPLYDATEGTPIIALFNETLKKYEIIQIGKKSSPIIRFKIIDKCSSQAAAPNYANDPWTQFAGYLDKFPNNHILGIRINCDGQPVNKNGEVVSESELNDPDLKNSIYVNLLDTCGIHGPAFAALKSFGQWQQEASTGFAAKIAGSDGSCAMGNYSGQCSGIDSELESYDILFLESYARFVECTLTQDLYPSASNSQEYGQDQFKSQNLDGNSAATINQIYGNPHNGKTPKFFDQSGTELPFRVFDSFKDVDKEKNPFRGLKTGDKVLAVFDDTKKKYIIYQAVNSGANKIVKFALVDNKDVNSESVRAVLVDKDGAPVDSSNEKLTADNFEDNLITVYDPFKTRPSAFGPALGGQTFEEHTNGIEVDDGLEESIQTLKPFIGFAMKHSGQSTDSSSGSSGSSSSTGGEGYYEIIQLESFAKFVIGKIGTVSPQQGGYYYGARTGYSQGLPPVTRTAIENGFNLRVGYPLNQSSRYGKYIVGDFKSSGSGYGLANKIDGCQFIAQLDSISSICTNSKEELVYTIVEAEYVATSGQTTLKKQTEAADILNASSINEDSEGTNLSSTYYGGFQWNKQDSKQHYEAISIQNRADWAGKPFFVKGAIVYTKLSGIDGNGNPYYAVEDGNTIARVFECKATGGKTGSNPTDSERKVTVGDLYLGNALAKGIDQPPKFKLADQKWMTYQGGPMFGMLNENAAPAVVTNADLYKIIYAREAPSLITGTAKSKFEPKTASGISVEVTQPSGPGSDKAPVTTLITKADNPMGYGAESGDYVTLQRYYTGVGSDDGAYKYIVIGTGAPPGSGSGGSTGG